MWNIERYDCVPQWFVRWEFPFQVNISRFSIKTFLTSFYIILAFSERKKLAVQFFLDLIKKWLHKAMFEDSFQWKFPYKEPSQRKEHIFYPQFHIFALLFIDKSRFAGKDHCLPWWCGWWATSRCSQLWSTTTFRKLRTIWIIQTKVGGHCCAEKDQHENLCCSECLDLRFLFSYEIKEFCNFVTFAWDVMHTFLCFLYW